MTRILCTKALVLLLLLAGSIGIPGVSLGAQELVPSTPSDASGAARGGLASAPVTAQASSAAGQTAELVRGSEPFSAVAGDLSGYRLRVGDSLEIKVYQEDDLNAVVQVDHEGGISLALIGRVAVLGLTLDAAQRLIAQRYDADYLVNPQVLLTVKQLAPRRFSVIGEVTRPGVFEIPAREKVNLLQAIAMAGGYTRLADSSKIRIRRVTEKGEEIIRLNGRTLAREAVEVVPVVMDNDTISVGLSFF